MSGLTGTQPMSGCGSGPGSSESDPVGADAYRDSFKFFKSSYSLTLTPTPGSSPLLRRRSSGKGKRNSGKVKGCESISSSDSGGDKDDNNGESSCGWNPAYRDRGILLPYPPKGLDDKAEECKRDRGRETVFKREIDAGTLNDCQCYRMWGLRPPGSWTVVDLTFPEGLIVIKNPFTSAGQRYWITRALLDFPHHPDYVTNMDNLNRLEKLKKGGAVGEIKDFKLDTSSKDFYEKLRWVTFGYHHDWDTKIYSEKMRSKFPEDLADMTRYISQVLQFSQFEAEAAIANYYHMDSTLSGHVDRSEVNQPAPLFSLSFGQSAIFLIGGKTKAEVPQAVLLQSGDIAVMSGESRLSYHGVPKILPSQSQPWSFEFTHGEGDRKSANEDNLPKRQKLDTTTDRAHSTAHDCASFNATLKDPHVFSKVNDMKWTDFVKDYIQKSRINLNIRQVLFPGQSCLT